VGVFDTLASPLFEYEFIFGQRASFVTEEEVDLAKVFVEGHGLDLAVLKFSAVVGAKAFGFDYVHHFDVVCEEGGYEDLNHLEDNQELEGYELIEKEVEGEEDVGCLLSEA
jgi:hypothetical protein